VARILADGTVDDTFGDHGVAHAPAIASYFTDVVVQPDGKPVASGQAPEFSVVRFDTNGAPDPTFGIQGAATVFGGGQGVAYSLALRPDGRIVAAGGTAAAMTFSLAQLTSSGVLDPTFGTGGQVFTKFTLPTNGWPGGIALQSDGRLLVTGVDQTPTRFLANGSADTTYDANSALSQPGFGVGDVALQSDGSAVVSAGVSRYNASGILDTTFGMSGLATLAASCSGASWVAVQPDGRLVFVGTGARSAIALARLNPDGSIDDSFGGSGCVLATFNANYQLVEGTDVALQADGRIVVVGFSEANVGPELQIVPIVTRYWP
jgi:uncharacterized delta-60 repeat protein